MEKKLRITLTGSLIGGTKIQRDTVASLGLRKRHQSRIVDDNPTFRGMANAVPHLVKVEEVEI
jgi:large subunit ribosomal protein L30